ncbi:MAG: hypothetical protein ABFD97_01460 [Syntrophobacter sp.]
MNEEKMRLPGLERVKVIGGLYPKLMEIADPIPDWFFERLSKEELVKVIEVGIKYQNKLINVEMGRLKALAETLEEVQKVIHGFK